MHYKVLFTLNVPEISCELRYIGKVAANPIGCGRRDLCRSQHQWLMIRKRVTLLPSTRNLKCWTAEYEANNSRSNLKYRSSTSDNILLKNVRGCQEGLSPRGGSKLLHGPSHMHI